MKRIMSTMVVCMLLVSSAVAQEISDRAWLKLLGEATTTPFAQLDNLAIKENVLEQFKIDESAEGEPLICGHPNNADPEIAFSTPQQLNASFITREKAISWVRFMKAPPPWTGWSRSRSVE